jgi:hypothetical protein
MRTGAARGQVGHFHEAGFYGSDAEFAALIVPFAEEGIAAGEPVIIGYDDRKSGLLRSWLTDPPPSTSSAIRACTQRRPGRSPPTGGCLNFMPPWAPGKSGSPGTCPIRATGGRFEGWDRYESAVNTVWQDFPVWGRCLYDTATAPQAVLDVAERTHPRIVSPSGQRRASGRYQGRPGLRRPPLRTRSARRLRAHYRAGQPIRRRRPARAHADRPRPHPRTTLDDLLIGVSEAVSNAQRHGRPPATVRIWATPGRIVSPFTTQAAAQPIAWQA